MPSNIQTIELGKAQFKNGKATRAGTIKIRALVLGNLAIHKTVKSEWGTSDQVVISDNYWTITHVPTGRAVANGFYTALQALRGIQAIQALPWDNAPLIKKQLKAWLAIAKFPTVFGAPNPWSKLLSK